MTHSGWMWVIIIVAIAVVLRCAWVIFTDIVDSGELNKPEYDDPDQGLGR